MVIIYTPHISPRFNYVVRQVCERFLRVEYRVVQERPVKNGKDFLVDYSNTKGEADLYIRPSGFLQENNIDNTRPPVNGKGRDVKIFPNDSEHFGFDLFSAIFWMLSRYEEYQPFEPDHHQRFPAKASLAFQNDFLAVPVVDQWVHTLRELINQKNNLVPVPAFTIINTIDVDNAYAYKGKGFLRQSGALLQHLFKGQWSSLGQRLKVLRGKAPDPYDNYAYIRATAEKSGTQTIFFHLGGSLAAHDRNISFSHPAYTQLLQELKTWSVQGIHPSYQSNTNERLVLQEKQELETVTGEKVEYSRQHFLKLRFPQTYRNLLQAGIKYDFSMGFADQVGFRAGTGRAFSFFDLAENRETELLVQPLCVMEGTLRDYMHLSPEAALVQVQSIQNELKALGSTYVAIWHNETLGEVNGWEGWRKVYEVQFGQ